MKPLLHRHFRPGDSPVSWHARSAFTLVELLVSMTVLTLLLTMISQMVNSTAALTSGSTHHLDADSQARLVFDRMAVDFSQIVKRQDVDYYFQKNGNGSPGMNDQMAFYSESTGYYPSGVTGATPKSNAALVGYCIVNNQLVRLNKALIWNGVTDATTGAGGLGAAPPPAMTFVPQTNTATSQSSQYLGQTLPYIWPLAFGGSIGSPPTTPDMTHSTDPDYQVIGEQVFRMELSFLVRNQSYPAQLAATPYIVGAGAQISPPLPYNAMSDTVAVVVTLAVLDDASRLIVQSSAVTSAAGLFTDSSYPALTTAQATLAPTPASAWQNEIDSGNLAASGTLPKLAASQVRIYERYFNLGNSQ